MAAATVGVFCATADIAQGQRPRRPATTPAPRITSPAPLEPLAFDSTVFSTLSWREIGPARGGRSVAVAGSVQRPNEYWMGTTGGGVFKTTDGGQNWSAASDGFFGGTIGAITVDPQNADVVWVGGGETDIRGNTAPGDGLWKTADGGKRWTMLGFRDEHIAAIRVHPTNGNTAWLAVFGNPFAASSTRGVYKTIDGGQTFTKVLFVDDSTGAIDLQLDPSNPDVIYAATWQAYRTSWSLSSGGAGSGIWKSTDGGTAWTSLSRTAAGLPRGVTGKIGLAISPARPSRLWAIIEHDSGGVYRSDDAGATWQYLNRDRKLRQRAWYYSNLVADPKDTNVVYALNVGFYRSRDGGVTFREPINVPHPDNHDLWIAPDNPQRMVEANDGGATVSTNGGRSWTDQEFPTAQFYHVDTSNDYPYLICGAQQDNSTLCGP
ncbi:MAG: glycosyl hydrolase, partial [Gemmatimonadaceae bacterium]|nr:glycosyl hydrolase [Gemmatimonadaceae bacterium]